MATKWNVLNPHRLLSSGLSGVTVWVLLVGARPSCPQPQGLLCLQRVTRSAGGPGLKNQLSRERNRDALSVGRLACVLSHEVGVKVKMASPCARPLHASLCLDHHGHRPCDQSDHTVSQPLLKGAERLALEEGNGRVIKEVRGHRDRESQWSASQPIRKNPIRGQR